MLRKTLAIPVGLIGLLTLCSGCASFTPPKPPALKLPTLPKVGTKNLNPFAKKPDPNPPQTAGANRSELPGNRGFSLSKIADPFANGPGMRSMLTGTTPDTAKAQASYTQAQQLYQQAQTATGDTRTKLFREAAAKYAKAGDRFPDPALKEDALFLAGESYFFGDDYPAAAEAFSGLIKAYPNTRHIDIVDARRFKVSEYWVNVEKEDSKYDLLPNVTNKQRPAVDTFGYAMKLYDRIRYDNPNGKLADDATMAAAAAYFGRGDFGEANELLDDLRKNFPSSEHQFQAHLLGLKCKMQVYAGPEYDGTVLDESEELVRRMRITFPDKSREHDQYLVDALKDLRLKQAEREFNVAKYYDRRSEYGAAELYYDRVREDYQDTNLAIESSKRLAQIESLPDKPSSSMDWLADAFPKELDPQPLLARESSAPLK